MIRWINVVWKHVIQYRISKCLYVCYKNIIDFNIFWKIARTNVPTVESAGISFRNGFGCCPAIGHKACHSIVNWSFVRRCIEIANTKSSFASGNFLYFRNNEFGAFGSGRSSDMIEVNIEKVKRFIRNVVIQFYPYTNAIQCGIPTFTGFVRSFGKEKEPFILFGKSGLIIQYR